MPLLEMMSYTPLTGNYHLQVLVKVYRTCFPNQKRGSLQAFNPMTGSFIGLLRLWLTGNQHSEAVATCAATKAELPLYYCPKTLFLHRL